MACASGLAQGAGIEARHVAITDENVVKIKALEDTEIVLVDAA